MIYKYLIKMRSTKF